MVFGKGTIILESITKSNTLVQKVSSPGKILNTREFLLCPNQYLLTYSCL